MTTLPAEPKPRASAGDFGSNLGRCVDRSAAAFELFGDNLVAYVDHLGFGAVQVDHLRDPFYWNYAHWPISVSGEAKLSVVEPRIRLQHFAFVDSVAPFLLGKGQCFLGAHGDSNLLANLGNCKLCGHFALTPNRYNSRIIRGLVTKVKALSSRRGVEGGHQDHRHAQERMAGDQKKKTADDEGETHVTP